MHVPGAAFQRTQIDACFDDFRIGAVKLGMPATAEVIEAVADTPCSPACHSPRMTTLPVEGLIGHCGWAAPDINAIRCLPLVEYVMIPPNNAPSK